MADTTTGKASLWDKTQKGGRHLVEPPGLIHFVGLRLQETEGQGIREERWLLEGKATALPHHVARWPPHPGTQLGLQGPEQYWAPLMTGGCPGGSAGKESACSVGD